MIKKGEKAPEFTLLDQHGTPRSLSGLLAEKMVVLYFYPKDETTGCTIEACAFRDAYEDFVEAGAEVVGVSIDSVESHLEFAENRRLPFVLLSDPEKKVQAAYGADGAFLGILNSRITFLIDQDGKVQHVFSSLVQFKKHVGETLKALQKIKAIVSGRA